jgi:periplasmic divalent cation tolerance protein
MPGALTPSPGRAILRTAPEEANSMTEQVIVALSSCPDEAHGRRIAEALVSERLATCVNRVTGMTSTYFWDGRLQDQAEILLIMKTTAARLAELQARLTTLHPYELPELVVLPVAGGNDRYLQWVRTGVAPASAANTANDGLDKGRTP